MGKLSNDYAGLVREVRGWTQSTEQKIKGDIPVSKDFTNVSEKIINIFDSKVYNNSEGLPYRISFKMPRHGVFVSKGVGSGYKAYGDTTLKVAKISKKQRVAVDWFNSNIRKRIDELKQIYTQEMLEIIEDKIYIK